jgi:DNA topoisomerase-1
MSYTLVISEKKEAAERIARALDDLNNPKKRHKSGVPYFEAVNKGRRLIIVPAIGHLYSIAPKMTGRFFYPVFNVKWTPVYITNKKSKMIKKWIKVISILSEKASEYISATDYDIEGEVIGYTILKYACTRKEKIAQRMTFSTLTEQELSKAYEKKSKNINFALAEAGETRHKIDFLWGVNLSRALTLANKNWSKRYVTISTGRVQAPTLKFLVDRERDIQKFVPVPYWAVVGQIIIDGKKFDAPYKKQRIEEDEAKEIVDQCQGKDGYVTDIIIRNYKESAPSPFNLGSLQSEAYRLFGYTPSQTLRIAESLYLNALISYPRTSSQKIPTIINCNKILSSLNFKKEYKNQLSQILLKGKLSPAEGESVDPAHPAIHPTGNSPKNKLNTQQNRIFDLIVKRFISAFGESTLKQSITVIIEVDGYVFHLYGRRILDEGWTKFYYPYIKMEDKIIPSTKIGDRINFLKIRSLKKYTKPPPRFNPSSLLKLLEEQQIGTKTTRADIIDTLYRRGYIRNRRVIVTKLGFNLMRILEEYCQPIASVEFTRRLESKMNLIEIGQTSQEEVIIEAVKELSVILKKVKNKETEIGRELSEILRQVQQDGKKIGFCPICKTGELTILRSKRTGKRFVGCTNFKEGICKASYPLPQSPYIVVPSRKSCITCSWPVLRVRSPGKRAWNLCLNPECPKKKRNKNTLSVTRKN